LLTKWFHVLDKEYFSNPILIFSQQVTVESKKPNHLDSIKLYVYEMLIFYGVKNNSQDRKRKSTITPQLLVVRFL